MAQRPKPSLDGQGGAPAPGESGPGVATLGAAGEDLEVDMLAWVTKNRAVAGGMEGHTRASDRENRQEKVTGDSGASGAISGDQLKIKQHALDALDKSGHHEEMILTLADRDILQGDDIDEEEGIELENVREAELRRRARANARAEKRRPLWEEEEGGLLDKYDEEEEEATFVVGGGGLGGGRGDLGGGARVKAGESVKSRLEQAKMSLLAPLKRVGGDYYTAEEVLEGKKTGTKKGKKGDERDKKKRKRHLKKKALTEDEIADLEDRAAGTGNEKDLGTREDRAARLERKRQAELDEAEERRGKFDAALRRANVKSEWLREDRPGEGGGEEDEEEAALAASMAKARAVALKSKAQAVPCHVEDVAKQAILRREKATRECAVKKEEDDSGMLTFTDVGEFVVRSMVKEDGVKDEEGAGDMYMDVEVKTEDGIGRDARGRGRRTYRRHGGGEDAGGFGPGTEVEIAGAGEDVEDNEGNDGVNIQKGAGEDQAMATDNNSHDKLGPGLGSVLSLLKDRGELNKPVEWGGRTNDSRNSFFTNAMGGYKDVYTGGRTDNDIAANVEVALTRKDEFGRIMTPKEAFRKFCHNFHGIQPSQNSKEKRLKQAQRELAQKRRDAGQGGGERKLREVQKNAKTPFVSLDGTTVKPGQQR